MTDCRQILEQTDAALTDVFAPFFCLLFVGLVKAVYAYVLENIGSLYVDCIDDKFVFDDDV